MLKQKSLTEQERLPQKRAAGKREIPQNYIDLHLHLDGAVTPSVAKRLCQVQGISPSLTESELEGRLTVGKDCKSLNDFLRCFELPLSLLQTEIGIETAVKEVLFEQKRQGVLYAELRFAPQLHCEKGLTQQQAVEAALKGTEAADIRSNLILCLMRGKGNGRQNAETVGLCEKYLTNEQGVAALDLAGAEGLFPTRDYTELFAKAAEKKIPFTIHAGEAGGAEDVVLAIKAGARRIGHGVRAADDDRAVELLKNEGVTLEMCPTSNLLTGAYDMKKYPLKEFMQKGVAVTVNTDDPAIENTDIKREFEYAAQLCGLSAGEQDGLLKNAAAAAFASDAVKKEIFRSL